MFTQDLPSMLLRIYILVKCGFFVHPTLYFFVMKNFLLIMIQLFRFCIIYTEFRDLKKKTAEMTRETKGNQIEPFEEPANRNLTKKGVDFINFLEIV